MSRGNHKRDSSNFSSPWIEVLRRKKTSTHHSHQFSTAGLAIEFLLATTECNNWTEAAIQHNVNTIGLFALSEKQQETVKKRNIVGFCICSV